MKNKLASLLFISLFTVSGCSTIHSDQGLQTQSSEAELDKQELTVLEGEVQELKSRILTLEARLASLKNAEEPAILKDGWKDIRMWRKLKTGMDYESVEKILGPAGRIDGGVAATWYYENGGQVEFFKGSVHGWREPN